MNFRLERAAALHYMSWTSMGDWRPVEELYVMRRSLDGKRVSSRVSLIFENQATAASPERVAVPLVPELHLVTERKP